MCELEEWAVGRVVLGFGVYRGCFLYNFMILYKRTEMPGLNGVLEAENSLSLRSEASELNR